MPRPTCVCGAGRAAHHLLCRPCWFGIAGWHRSEVLATYDEAKRNRRSGESLREALLRHRPYRRAATDARRAARALSTPPAHQRGTHAPLF